jgi:hypothetical protein
MLAGACGRTPFLEGAGGTTSTSAIGGSGGNLAGGGQGGMGHGGRGSGGNPTGFGGSGGSTDAGIGPSLNSHGDCVIADVRSNCRPAYEDQVSRLCLAGSTMQSARCAGHLILAGSEDESMYVCYYDAGTRRLTAALDCSDIPQYCDSQAWCTWMGPDVGLCYMDGPQMIPPQQCPLRDAGRN